MFKNWEMSLAVTKGVSEVKSREVGEDLCREPVTGQNDCAWDGTAVWGHSSLVVSKWIRVIENW